MPTLYIIAGCNGAGKTTASYIVLPRKLEVMEFVNADEIAKGLSPFQPEKVAIEAGRIMLHRINELLEQQKDFGFETTLSTRSYVNLIARARLKGYKIVLIYYWLLNVRLAIKRVRLRVSNGGHNIPEDVIIRRYYRGAKNFLSLYIDKVDSWLLYDNSGPGPEFIAGSQAYGKYEIADHDKWMIFNNLSADDIR